MTAANTMEKQDSENEYKNIDTPDQLRKLPVEALPAVCSDLRNIIIENLSTNPGHFASSMGAVEIAVALHYCLDTPADKIVWDVGHQAYAHKLLTGRRDAFSTLRKDGGLSGFPNPKESKYDTFTAGHASNSISAALGMAIAEMSKPREERRRTVAVIGDASISGGLAFEGLNNASQSRNNLLIILNDNDMSIDLNVGALHRYLSRIHTSRHYNDMRDKWFRNLRDRGLITERGRGVIMRFNNSVKSLVAGNQNIFEGLNIRYFGPYDGHDIASIVEVLDKIKDMEGPRILHLKTVKGKGFEEAEKNPSVWHAPGCFNPITGERPKSSSSTPVKENWQKVMGRELLSMARKDNRIVGITAAMPSGTSMDMLMAEMPDRVFDVGISEGHAVTFAGGMAAAGKRPYVAIYSSFLQRAYDNIIHDVAIQGLPVTFLIDRAGIVGADGVTHHGMFDLAYLRVIPGMNIASPRTQFDLRSLMHTALQTEGPIAIRYPRGSGADPLWDTEPEILPIGKARELLSAPDSDIAVASIGPVGEDVLTVVSELEAEVKGRVAVYDMLWLKPLDTELLNKIALRHRHLITVEDGAIHGGLASAIAEYYATRPEATPIMHPLGAPDDWISHGSVENLRHKAGYARADIKAEIEKLLGSSDK